MTQIPRTAAALPYFRPDSRAFVAIYGIEGYGDKGFMPVRWGSIPVILAWVDWS